MEVIILVIITAVVIWQFLQIQKLRSTLSKVFGKSNPQALERQLYEYSEMTSRVMANLDKMADFFKKFYEEEQSSIHKAAMIRFNPFEDMGGEHSFALALLDKNDNGIVMSSLHGRENTRMYAKEVIDGKSKQQLSKEEEKVLKEAISKKVLRLK
jgi:transcriptional accessory protein Tex/SPT6